MTQFTRNNVIVVGAGITGCFVAYFLARLGIATTLIEQSGVGNQASGSNPGGLNPLHGAGIPGPLASLAMESFRLHLDHWQAIRELSGMDFGGRAESRVALAFEEADLVPLERTLKLHEGEEGFSAHWVDRAALLHTEPRLNPSVIKGLLTEGNAAVDSHRYTVAVAQAAVKLGVKLLAGCVRDLKRTGERVTSVVLDSEELACESVVLATGPWVADPIRWLGVPIPVEALKGELLHAAPPGPALKQNFTWRDAALYSQPDGTVLLGGTELRAGFDAKPSVAGRNAILNGVAKIIPAIRSVEVKDHFAALRPVTPDSLPIVGRPPTWENVVVATGAGRKGMLLSAGIGSAVADQIADRAPSANLDSFSLERFDAVA